MAGSTSLPSVVAVFPPLGGLRTNCRVVCLRPHLHNGVRILWGGVSSSGLAHWRIGGANGVARGVDEVQPAPRAQRRTKKAVKEEEEGEEIEGAESDSATPASERKSTPKRRKPKVVEADDASVETKEVKVGTRRRRRSSARSGGAAKTETSASSKVSEAEVGGDETVGKNNVEAPVETEKKGLPRPRRRRRKAAAKSPDAPANGAATDAEDSSRELEDASLSSSPAREDEHVHGGDLGFAEELSSVAEADVDPEKSAKVSRPRKKRGKAVKVSGDKELQLRVQETAVPSLNGSVERGALSEEVGEVQDEVKKKRRRRTKIKPDTILEDTDAAQSDDGSQLSSGAGEDEASNHEDPVLEPEEPPPPRKSARRRRRDAQKLAAAQAEANGESDASGALMSSLFSMGAPGEFEPGSPWNGSLVDTDGGVSRVQFPAPTWGPQWWEEIQSKSQATISFQDIAERKEGFQTRAKVPQELESDDGEAVDIPEVVEKRADMTESAEQRRDHTVDSDVPSKVDSAFRSNKDEYKTRRRIAKVHPAQKSPQESLEDRLRRKMLALGKPTEEPWLSESTIAAESEQESSGEARFAPKQDVLEAPASHEEPRKVVHDVPRPDNGDVKKEPEVEVEILINTSECTMQRTAILENKKLVEFSIEPVNTKVQVGNIYLGRVKQLLPGMSGVFVDIGGSRLALLDIARNQYPYTFPPVYSSENSSPNNSVSGASLEDEDLGLSEDEVVYTEEEDDGDDDEDADEDEEGSEELLDGASLETEDSDDSQDEKQEVKVVSKTWRPHKQGGPITVNFGRKFSRWRNVEIGMPIIVQVKKESMGKKGPRLTAFPSLAGRFWVVIPRGNAVGVSARITGPERRRLKLLAQALQPRDFGITVRTEAVGHEQEELERDLTRLMDTWKEIMEKAAAAALAVERGEDAAVPVVLHREMGQTLTIIRDLFTEKISRLVVDSPQSHQEVINYLQEVAPHLISRVVLYTGKVPIFDKFHVEVDLERFSSERVKLPNGGYLVMQETEALVSIDVNGGTGMLGHSTKQREAVLDVNLAAARQIASEIRLRDIGGIIVVDFIDMDNSEDERLVHEEMRKAIQRDRSKVSISEISEFGLMEMTRKRVRPSVTLTINSTCSTCKGTGRVEALETTLSKIERAIRRVLAEHPDVGELSADASTWPQVLLRVEPSMLDFLKSWKKKRIVQMGHSLKVWISLKAGMELTRGQFEVALRQNSLKKASAEPHHGSQTNLQQEKAVTAPVLGKRVWPKRKRFFS